MPLSAGRYVNLGGTATSLDGGGSLVDVGEMSWPVPYVSGPDTAGNRIIDAAGEKVAFIFEAPKTGTIDRLLFRTLGVTSGATVDVRLETIDASNGHPSGTLWGTDTNGAQGHGPMPPSNGCS